VSADLAGHAGQAGGGDDRYPTEREPVRQWS